MATSAADSLARAYWRASPRVRSMPLRHPWRRLTLRTVFTLMERRFAPPNGSARTAVVQWEIGAGDRVDRWQLVIDGDRCRATRRLDHSPTVTIKLDDPAFLDLISGREAGVSLYMSGRLRIGGNLMEGARLPALFAIPKQPPARRA